MTSTPQLSYDEAGHLPGEYDAQGDLIQETVWLGDIPVATLRPDGSGGIDIFYVHTDHLNTPRRVTRPVDNVVVWRWQSAPFGATDAEQDPDGDQIMFAYNLRFPGQYRDRANDEIAVDRIFSSRASYHAAGQGTRPGDSRDSGGPATDVRGVRHRSG